MNEWISVKVQLPSQEWVLLTDGDRIWIGQIDNHFTNNFFCKCCLQIFNSITHWAKLPILPIQYSNKEYKLTD